MEKARCLLAAPMLAALAGCVQVAAPDKPIEINLNINIRQEVLLRLQQDAKELIEQNEDIF
ncbi:YnbE family lipoprotein [Sphingosinicella rhizophila]|uniref:YnbE family lipoprotein n=1 Tax=Sphingosinicella rhizophila TaxID=3050082 RepID=A0ABU3QBW8_9SPHN|nr:YnbE family lipoprotein [Sphingosinicella sp. GR2756]MDT9600445.1 YnbE family lipoprotein [Sphingosinicella sp. GR2756]